ncbi:MAG: metal-dependent hydrolase [Methanoregulaceae archaeon]|jgi:inner membrane protein|nr:metal-dependent hydrolase [Methanoregulaceae archaeon]
MDMFTHAVAISLILFATGNSSLIPFGVLGAVIIDIDVAYFFIARRNPSLYLLYHGGINHSIFGAALLSVIGSGVVLALSSVGLLPGSLQGVGVLAVFAAVLAGASLHLFLDWIPAPGLPLLYPLTERRYGLSLYPMSLYLGITALSLVSLGIILAWGFTSALVSVYWALFTLITIVSLGLKWYVYKQTRGTSYPTFHPLRWIVIREESSSYPVMVYEIFRGVIRDLSFEKYTNITPSDARIYDNLPEVKRHTYFSYIHTVEKNGSEIIFRDPVREGGLISYPPWYPSVTIQTGDAAS